MASIKMDVIGEHITIDFVNANNTFNGMLEDEAEKVKKLLEQPTKGFKKVKVRIDTDGPKKAGANSRVMRIGTIRNTKGNRIYGYISHGVVKKKFTTPKPWPMRFLLGYSAATSPANLSGGTKSRSGVEVRARSVMKGITARNFSDKVVSRRKGFFQRIARTRMRHFARGFWK